MQHGDLNLTSMTDLNATPEDAHLTAQVAVSAVTHPHNITVAQATLIKTIPTGVLDTQDLYHALSHPNILVAKLKTTSSQDNQYTSSTSTAKMFKTVLFLFLNLFSLAVLGLPTGGMADQTSERGLNLNIGGIVSAGFGSPGAMLTLHSSSDCSGASQGSYYLLSGQPTWNNPTSGTLSISVGSSADSTVINFFSGKNAGGNKLGSTTGNNVCAKFGAEIDSAQLVV
ncbi:hypothetical protein PG993_013294 [Apiospora rasikravindrae]|uniref:Uncharacterized protein n=1 Tax=Apiospora rasikravindrae TaxID=990691 RepID=A0ABR1RX86_9PEZI